MAALLHWASWAGEAGSRESFREHPQPFPGLRLSGSWLCARECGQRWSTSMNLLCGVFVLLVENGDPSLRGACVVKLCNPGSHGLRICPKAKLEKASQLNKHKINFVHALPVPVPS